MGKPKRSVLDNIGTRLREVWDDLERLINPPQPKRVPVPIPVRVPRPNDRRNPYDR
jgi:hypothetical protein